MVDVAKEQTLTANCMCLYDVRPYHSNILHMGSLKVRDCRRAIILQVACTSFSKI